MTNLEWNAGIEFLINAKVGDYVEHLGRTVTVENMCGGRYLCLNEDNDVVGLAETEIGAMAFLRFGKIGG